jgi:hypothetical protein
VGVARGEREKSCNLAREGSDRGLSIVKTAGFRVNCSHGLVSLHAVNACTLSCDPLGPSDNHVKGHNINKCDLDFFRIYYNQKFGGDPCGIILFALDWVTHLVT